MAKRNNQDRSELAAELAKYAGLPVDVNEAQAIIHQRRKNVHSMTTAAGGKRYESDLCVQSEVGVGTQFSFALTAVAR